eukprot:TRINITY_DN17678_c0_g1_i1.p1 TRINITY_DN17678_c0_g1~~TRINITY_DN17678_c0_g1_i1.p1  ORF type:complete len:166 (-),score=46.14 TRINITY_DN17678_c0_g1_i1:149-646(-)
MATKQQMVIETARGRVVVRLRDDAAPKTCAMMRDLIARGSYDDCCFYRAEPGFVVQGGLRTAKGAVKSSNAKCPLEYKLPNKRGTVTMARWEDTNSGSGEFFINLNDNTNLDKTGDSGWALGFCVFGEVVEGMDVVEAVAKLPTAVQGGLKMLTTPVVFRKVTLC